MTTRRTVISGLGAAGGAALLPRFAFAQSFPSRPVTLIVPFGAGGVGDVICRAIAQKASGLLGQNMIVENRAGGGGLVGAQAAAQAAPDGHTILMLTGSSVGASLLQPDFKLNFVNDYVPLIGIGGFPCILCTSKESEIQTLADIKTVADRDDGVRYGTGGIGSYGNFGIIRVLAKLGAKPIGVQYNSNAEALQAVIGNHVQLSFPTTVDAQELLVAGQLRALVVTSDERLEALPDVPTTAEVGYPEINTQIWYGFLAPAGTPPEVASVLHDAIAAAAQDPEITEMFAHFSYQPRITDGATFTGFLTEEIEVLRTVIEENNITI